MSVFVHSSCVADSDVAWSYIESVIVVFNQHSDETRASCSVDASLFTHMTETPPLFDDDASATLDTKTTNKLAAIVKVLENFMMIAFTFFA